MSLSGQVIRAQYGAAPAERIDSSALRKLRREVAVAGWAGRHAASAFGMRRLSGAEAELLAACAARAAFQLWRPAKAPAGFSVSEVELAPYSCDAATMHLSRGDRRAFEIAQRRPWLPLLEELATARVAFTRVPGIRIPMYVVHGGYGGEPIDHAFWMTRRALHFELGALRLEFREVVGRGPGLSTLINFARWACREKAPQE